jgi:hypothetical protein
MLFTEEFAFLCVITEVYSRFPHGKGLQTATVLSQPRANMIRDFYAHAQATFANPSRTHPANQDL